MRRIIVDGYNVIRADPRYLAFERVSLEHARDVLIRTLAGAPRLANDQIVVVFDGRMGRRQHVHRHRVGRIDVLYSAQGQTADEVIVQLARTSVGGTVIVVTNDVAVRESCRAEGCEVSGSENLLGQVPGTPAGCVAPNESTMTTSIGRSRQRRRETHGERRSGPVESVISGSRRISHRIK